MLIVKYLLIALLLLVALMVVAVTAGQLGLLAGKPPDDLGLRNGQLKAPSRTNNSVSSQAALHGDHPMRSKAEIAALPMTGDVQATMTRLQTVVAGMPGARIVKSEPAYMRAEFTTRWMKYTDDVEFAVDEVGRVVHVRSASRLGQEDFNANRARVEAIRAKLADAR